MKTGYRVLFVLSFLGALNNPAQAQDPQPYKNVVSVNPFGLLLTWFNAEYERVAGESITIGVGGSTFEAENDLGEDERYTNADVFFRYYPSGRPLDGWAFGAKVGVTDVVDQGTYAGFGFDVNRSWLLGKRNNFYVGVGLGLKRLIGVPAEDDLALEYIPTFRIINIGFAF